MKGKKKNIQFVSDFINLNNDKEINEIVSLAQTRVNEIDELLKTIINLKEERANLLDVIFTLKK